MFIIAYFYIFRYFDHLHNGNGIVSSISDELLREDNLCACDICMMLRNRDEQEWDDEVECYDCNIIIIIQNMFIYIKIC